MNKENTERLWFRFPRLYRGRTQTIRSSLIPFGFECGDGWYNLIYELSEKLEEKIREYEKQHPMTDCTACGCKKVWHYGYLSHRPGKCLKIKKRPKFGSRWYKTKSKFLFKVVQFFCDLRDNIFYDYEACWCDQYDPEIPAAIQVKEKFGGLRFYMTFATQEMYDIIYEYENKSYKTCEKCGSEDDVSLDKYGWIQSLCKKCREEEQ